MWLAQAPPAETLGALWVLLGWLARVATFGLVGAIIVLAIMLLIAWRSGEDVGLWRRLLVICCCCLVLTSVGSIVNALF
jgi:uncharacterized membrane protein YphA (DoxX/SURF4 family)